MLGWRTSGYRLRDSASKGFRPWYPCRFYRNFLVSDGSMILVLHEMGIKYRRGGTVLSLFCIIYKYYGARDYLWGSCCGLKGGGNRVKEDVCD